MKIMHQPDGSGLCGHFAIYHACLLAGETRTHENIYDGHGRRYLAAFAGISEEHIQQALCYLNISFKIRSTKHIKTAQKILDQYLALHCPIIASVDDGAHWIVFGGKKEKKYIYIDSFDFPIVQDISSEELKDWVGKDDFYYIILQPIHKTVVPLHTTKLSEIHRAIRRLN